MPSGNTIKRIMEFVSGGAQNRLFRTLREAIE